jgi:hypothetical protein
MTKTARKSLANRKYYERHRDTVRERRRARYWKDRERKLAATAARP